MTWEQIDGWFDFPVVYDIALERAKKGATFIEIGCYLGKSTAYMAQKIKESKKKINFFTIDPFVGEVGHNNAFLFERYVANIHACEVNDYVTTLVGLSLQHHEAFKDGSVDFVFIDGDHSYRGCRTDIDLYLPKVKSGGIIAGHDYFNAAGVKKAVDETFGDKVQTMGSSWFVQL